MKRWKDWLFLGTLLFFGLSLINISFALVGVICMVLPFMMRLTARDKLWCKGYCPRASLFSKVLKPISLGIKAPDWLYTDKTKQLVLRLFCINLFFASMSTMMVFFGRIEPMNYVRFLMAFVVPIQLPQFITLNLPPFIIHFSYRIFSIMFTSSIIGIIIGILYRPRSWCAICPVQTLTTVKKTSIKATVVAIDTQKK